MIKNQEIDDENLIKDPSLELLVLLMSNGPTYSSELAEEIAEKGISKPTFYRHIRKLEKQGCIKKEFAKKGRKNTLISITGKGRNFITPVIQTPPGINTENINQEFEEVLPTLFEKLEEKFQVRDEIKIEIITMWPFLSNNDPIIPKNRFNEIRLFILLNQINYYYNINNLISYSDFGKIFNFDEIDLKFYVKRLLETQIYWKWVRFEVKEGLDVFLLINFGFGLIITYNFAYLCSYFFHYTFLNDPNKILKKFGIKTKLETLFQRNYELIFIRSPFGDNKELANLLLRMFKSDLLLEALVSWIKDTPTDKILEFLQYSKMKLNEEEST
ncbi:MAG: MarR family winged helix-turn-helix transcriptional regulator [Candidatus Helarchaeota archaeon]